MLLTYIIFWAAQSSSWTPVFPKIGRRILSRSLHPPDLSGKGADGTDAHRPKAAGHVLHVGRRQVWNGEPSFFKTKRKGVYEKRITIKYWTSIIFSPLDTLLSHNPDAKVWKQVQDVFSHHSFNRAGCHRSPVQLWATFSFNHACTALIFGNMLTDCFPFWPPTAPRECFICGRMAQFECLQCLPDHKLQPGRIKQYCSTCNVQVDLETIFFLLCNPLTRHAV